LAELDGSVYQNKVGAFRVIPFYPRKAITIGKDSDNGFDLSEDVIQELADTTESADNGFVDYLFNAMLRLRNRSENDEGKDAEN
jgi:hypothetical protein